MFDFLCFLFQFFLENTVKQHEYESEMLWPPLYIEMLESKLISELCFFFLLFIPHRHIKMVIFSLDQCAA